MIKKDNANYLISRPNPLLLKKTTSQWESGECENWDFFAPKYTKAEKIPLKPIPSPEESKTKYNEEIKKITTKKEEEKKNSSNDIQENKATIINREQDDLYSGDIFLTEKEL